MYIKSIELTGFKSFANKTAIDFLPPKKGKNSITAIVGPNGSGKSNVSDGIRWVLGEQSMKQLRGKKSEDIIFAGSESKGKMSAAQVSLILDNTDNRIPVDYDEVVIARKIYRSGESEYLLNGNTIRLMDLQMLLAKAQFGHGSYSVIGQGVITQLLLQSPAERKAFFDEAVGIKEFQMKRHQALLKMNRTREHIHEADLLLNEISPRLKTLTRQVKKLEERKEIEIRLRELEEQYYVTLFSHNKHQADELRTSLDEIERDIKEKETALVEIQTELAGLAKESSVEEFSRLQKNYQDVLKEKSALEGSRASLTGRLQTEYAAAGKQNVGWLQNKVEQLKEKLDELSAGSEKMQSQVEVLQKQVADKQYELDNLIFERSGLQQEINSLEQKLLNASFQASMHQFTGLRAVEAILDNRSKFGEVFGAVAELASVREKFRIALDVAAGGHLSSIVVDTDGTAENCIRYLRDNQLGFATFLPLSKIRPRAIAQNIYELLDEPGVHGLAIELAEYDEKFDDIFSYVLGSTLIVDNIRIAREIGVGRVRMVTLQGDILELSGAMKGGFRKQRENDLSFGKKTAFGGSGADEIKEKIEQKKQELEQMSLKITELQADIQSQATQLASLTSKAELQQTQKQELSAELSGLQQELSLSSMSKEEYSVAMKDIEVQKDEIDGQLSALEETLQAASDAIEQFNKKEEEKKQHVFSLQDSMQQIQLALNDASSSRNEKKVALARIETKLEDIDEEVYRELRESIHSIVKRGVESLDISVLEQSQTNIQKMKYQLQLIGGIDEEIVQEYEEIKERHEGLTMQMDDLKKALKDLENLVEELDKIMKRKRSKAFKQIKEEFARYFSVLFEGGKADLVEVYGYEDEGKESVDVDPAMVQEDEDEDGEQNKKKKSKKILTGIEIVANPPGKKIQNIQALSGGERTMTSIALVCAILHTNPPPFVVLDEVEAALDEANTLRLTKILHELSLQSQFILITHNRATMHAADALYGVTMGNDGISKLLSVKLDQAQEMAEE
ncbi:AAA family ATPase [Candidatus Nomurabacteria bacterium]|nr:AAA family ATPase [Candidatus Nomurabacteria bacterium]